MTKDKLSYLASFSPPSEGLGEAFPYEIILASKSPRRQELLRDLGLKFRIQSMDTPEDFPEGLGMTEIPVFFGRAESGGRFVLF